MKKKRFQKEIDNIARQLVEKYGAQRVILFGSAARGEYDIDSDLDFLVVKDDVPEYGIDRIRELDHMIDRTIATDMLVYSSRELEECVQKGDPFIKSILKEGRKLHG